VSFPKKVYFAETKMCDVFRKVKCTRQVFEEFRKMKNRTRMTKGVLNIEKTAAAQTT